ncbi:MAG TPA: D-alanyl-D-alanine carboxypeptidase family protein [Capillimicrobium sp.]|nr:D-alanyl-D-alanine carboxypeptidase family protein [Capillimicrobium sp.]
MTQRCLAAIAAAALSVATATTAAAPAAAQGPDLDAPAAILVQPDTEDVVVARREQERRPIASTTKLMTALVTLENADLDDVVTAVRYRASPVESLMGLRAGERVTIRDLLEGLLLASGNDAAATLARRVGGSERRFVRMMNERARELGLSDTHYANPVGLDDPRNYSSAEDLAKLALILLRDPFFARTVNRRSATVVSGDRRRTIVNRNALVREVPWMNGVKTGYTSQAGYILVGSASRRGVRFVSAVLGAPSEAARDADTLDLMRFGQRRYRRVVALRRGAVLASPTLDFRADEHVDVVAARTVRAVVRRGQRPQVRVTGVPDELAGPLRRGQRVGTAVVSYRGRELARVPLVTAEAVPAAGVVDKVSSALPPIWLLAVAAAVLACSLHLVLRHRRRVRRRRARARRRRGTETA